MVDAPAAREHEEVITEAISAKGRGVVIRIVSRVKLRGNGETANRRTGKYKNGI